MIKQTAHLLAGILSLIITAGLLWGFSIYTRSLENRYANVLAIEGLHQGTYGSVLQQAAFHSPDLLVVYGSSEIERTAGFSSADFFKQYPTGFSVFDVVFKGGSALNLAQCLATVGSDLRGKKVVISFTPSNFLHSEPKPTYYKGNFSTMHAAGLTFSLQLSYDIKHLAAQHMLQFPSTLKKDPLLRFAIQNLAVDQPLNRLAYYLTLPLGQLDNLVFRLQDHWEILNFIKAHPMMNPNVPRIASAIKWNARLAEARRIQIALTSTNPYGVPNDHWLKKGKDKFFQKIPPGRFDTLYTKELESSEEWADLDMLMRILKELGAQPLIMSQPYNGALWDALGWSDASRNTYYDKLRREAANFGFQEVDFKGHQNDPLFIEDTASHPSRVGLVYANQALDAYYHGADLAQFDK